MKKENKKTMSTLHFLSLNAFLLGFWTLAWIITLVGVFKFSWILPFGSICNLIAFIGFYVKIKKENKK